MFALLALVINFGAALCYNYIHKFYCYTLICECEVAVCRFKKKNFRRKFFPVCQSRLPDDCTDVDSLL